VIGRAVPRVEDERLLCGQGRFLDDIQLVGAVEAAFLRSPHAHARVVRLDASAARAHPGVLAVLGGPEVAARLEPMVFDIAKLIPEPVQRATNPMVRVHPMPALASDRVTYAGQPLAMVVAVDRYVAEDALELIEVEFEPLPVVVDPEAALEPDAPLLEPAWGDNLAISFGFTRGDVEAAIAAADVVVSECFRSHRYASSPIETRGVAAELDAQDGTLSVWSSTQIPHLVRDFLARWLRRDPESIRVRAPDVGGSFGLKHSSYPEDLLVPFAALELGRPVKWVEDRAEDLAAGTHGREQVHRITVGATREGRILAVRDDVVMNAGAFNILGLVVPYNSFCHLLGPYAVDALEVRFRVALTNTGIVAPVRGAGRPEAVFAMERAMDRVARRLGLDPAGVRFQNLIPPDAMPYDTGITYRDGAPQVYDSGDYPALLRRARELVEREDFAHLADDTTRIGVGYAIYTEGTGVGPFESARVRIEPSGRIAVYTGASSQGQGHRTTLGQIAADTLAVPLEQVDVIGGDSSAVTQGFGTLASRTAVVAGNSVARAGVELRGRVFEVAGLMLETPPEELELNEGMIRIRGRRDVALGLADVAGFLSPFNPRRPPGAPVELEGGSVYRPGPVTWAAGAHAALVAVDVGTGAVRLLRFVVAHDCGRVINPAIVEGQIVGGVMQGIGGALYEKIVYDGEGQLSTGSFLDYTLPTAAEAPEYRLAHVDAVSPLNPLGIKGLGEGGAIGPPAAIANAVEDALAGLGVVVRQGPLTAARVLELIAEASKPVAEASKPATVAGATGTPGAPAPAARPAASGPPPAR
jgi:carbon-monoxide dehydrogenase large subunit